MGLFGLSAKDLTVGGVTAGFSMIPGFGLLAGPLAGAATSTIWSLTKEDKSWDEAIEGGVTAGVFAAIGGGLAGKLGGKLAGGTLARLRNNPPGVAQKFFQSEAKLWGLTSKHTTAGLTTRATGRGVGAAYANKFYDSWTAPSSPPPAGVPELPIKKIS